MLSCCHRCGWGPLRSALSAAAGSAAAGRAVACVVAAAVLGLAAPVPALAEPDDPWPYEWPVDGVVIDPFRPPATPYGSGNRGLEFATVPGSVARSAGTGRVIFAGRVGRRLHVTVAHPDRLRISYSGLASIAVGVGERLQRGEPVGTTGTRLHVGARAGHAYVDPAIVFGGRTVVRLVPPSGSSPLTLFPPGG